ncbi:5160_t:CDS:2, partial [Racocetra persica]
LPSIFISMSRSSQQKCRYATNAWPKVASGSTDVFESKFDLAASIEQEHALTLTQFGAPIPLYLNHNEEFQPIQT